MNILLTGASSFTGYWFAKALHDAGHDVVAPLRGEQNSYFGVRGERVARLGGIAKIAWNCAFGGSAFLDLAGSGEWDLLCHHAARVGDYRNPDFDVAGALEENARSLRPLLQSLAGRGLRGVVLTGSVFEQDEGVGSPPLRAFSPYGLSKGLTAQVFRFWCETFAVPFGKFVIPNPFGPYEEPRFGAYLMKCFFAGTAAEVRTPLYVRDNIHVDLLAAAYARFAEDLAANARPDAAHPSGYVESQGVFAKRFAAEMARRLDLKCDVTLGTQTEFSEPLMRINTQPAAQAIAGWDEAAAWDRLAEYYRERLAVRS